MSKNRIEHIRNDAKDLLEDEDIWHIIDNELSLRIREDPSARQATFAVMLTAFQPKPAHLMLLGESAVGKSWLLSNAIEFIPEENRALLGSSTGRAWFYCGEPVMRDHPLIPNKKIIDYYKVDWQSKVVGILDNVTPRTIEDLKPIMSHDKPEIDLQTVERSAGGRHRTRRVRVIGCPSFVNCSTWLKWNAEIGSRHFCLTPKDTPEKYSAAAQLLDEQHTEGTQPTSELTPQIKDAVRTLRDSKFRVVVSRELIADIKADFTMKSGKDVRDYERMLTLTEAVGWLHALQRDRTDSGQVIADERDLKIVRSFSEDLLRTSRTGTSAQVLDYYEKVLGPLAEQTHKDLAYDEIQSKYLEVYNRRLHRDIMILYNRTLQDLGKIELVKDESDKRRWLAKVK